MMVNRFVYPSAGIPRHWLLLLSMLALAHITSTGSLADGQPTVLIVLGDRSSLRLSLVASSVRANYYWAGWQITMRDTFSRSSLRQHLINNNTYNAIAVVAHGAYYPSHDNVAAYASFELTNALNSISTVRVDSMALWWSQPGRKPLDELVMHSCSLGKDTGLRARFGNPPYFVAWDWDVEYRTLNYFEKWLHHPRRYSPKMTSEGRQAEYEPLDSAPIATACLGGDCLDGTCLIYEEPIQGHINSGIARLDEGNALLEVGDNAGARAKLIEARASLQAAVELGAGDEVANTIVFIDELIALPLPIMTPHVVFVLAVVLLSTGGMAVRGRRGFGLGFR